MKNLRRKPVYVILAAGRSARMGFDKVVAPLSGRTPLERIEVALGERECVAVVPSHLVPEAADLLVRARIVINDEPDLGMTHSLRAGLRTIDDGRDFGVLLGDMASVTMLIVERTERLFVTEHADVCYPVSPSGVPGHPVIFSARARSVIDGLPAGDTLRMARDHDGLRRATWVCSDGGAFRDLDKPGDWESFSDA